MALLDVSKSIILVQLVGVMVICITHIIIQSVRVFYDVGDAMRVYVWNINKLFWSWKCNEIVHMLLWEEKLALPGFLSILPSVTLISLGPSFNPYKLFCSLNTELMMPEDTECLECGHKRKNHNTGDQTRCHKSKCPCRKFKPNILEDWGPFMIAMEITNALLTR